MDNTLLLDQETLRSYAIDVLEALQAYNDATRQRLQYARLWDEFFAAGMARGDFAGKNEATRLGEAINDNLELWTKLGVATDAALEAEHKFKEIMVIDKWVGRMIMVMTSEPSAWKKDFMEPENSPLSEEGYKEALKELMARRLGA